MATKILIVEHDLIDIELLQIHLRKGMYDFVTKIAQTEQEYRKALHSFEPDIILSDYSFPAFDGHTAYSIKREVTPYTPFILVTGTIGEENSIELIKNGVTDYVLKDNLLPLNTKIIRALKEARVKEAARKADESNSFKAELLNNIGQAVMSTDMAGTIQFWNKAAEEIFGWTKEEAMGSNILDLIPSNQTKEQAIEIIHELYKGNTWSGELDMQRKDGSSFTVFLNDSPIYDKENKLCGIIGIATDITERRNAELKLMQSEIRLKQSQETAHLGSWQLNFESGVSTWSDETCRIYGFSPEENEQSFASWVSFVHPEDLEEVLAAINEARRTLADNVMRHRIILRDGTVKHIHTESKFEFDKNGEPVGEFGIAHDITERKLAKIKLEQQNKELLKTNSELDRFVYSVSHDLRSPLTSVLGLLSFIESESVEPDTLEHADMIRSSIKRLDGFIKNILSYSKNNRTELEVEKIPVKKIVVGIVDSLKDIKEANGIDFEIDIAEGSNFYSDRQRFSTILENLISNAIKYHKDEQAGRYIKISGTSDFVKLELSVADNGIGIPPEYHERVFDMFYRLSSQAAGSGIGLYIVKETLEKLQGSIAITSEATVGTTFHITLKNLKP